MKILTIVGARPQFIKAATVSRAIAEHNQSSPEHSVQEILLHTGQHYDAQMSDVFFEQMQIPHPDYHLGIGGLSHGAMTGRMLEKIESIVFTEKPDAVLVYGDTNSTLAGTLAAVKAHIPVAHVEAGLRSYNLEMPEEVNRVLTDRVARWLFCPTHQAIDNLSKEGIRDGERQTIVKNVGDVMYDAALFYQEIATPSPAIASLLEKLDGSFYLATVHRAENTNTRSRLQSILTALDHISEKIPVVLPLHPRTRQLVGDFQISHIHILEPVSYFDMISLLQNCGGVFTDSGGLQKEAYFFGKPCVTLREETEWVELVDSGFNTLVGADLDKILQAENTIAEDFHAKIADRSMQLYGDGNAAQHILSELLNSMI